MLWLNRKGWLTFGRLVALGAILGNLPFVVIVIGIISVQLVSGTPVPEIGRNWYGLSGFWFAWRWVWLPVQERRRPSGWSPCAARQANRRSSLPLNAP